MYRSSIQHRSISDINQRQQRKRRWGPQTRPADVNVVAGPWVKMSAMCLLTYYLLAVSPWCPRSFLRVTEKPGVMAPVRRTLLS